MSKKITMDSWVGFDLDGTLAEYHRWEGANVIGEPLPGMVDRVKTVLASGLTVKIVTARVGGGQVHSTIEARIHIQDWCEKHFGERFEVTASKDFCMINLFDDRAIQVVSNTGMTLVEMFLELSASITADPESYTPVGIAKLIHSIAEQASQTA